MNGDALRHIDVLDRGYVELLATMPLDWPDAPGGSPLDLAVVKAARVSYKDQLKGESADRKLLVYLFKNHHTSPFEQVEFQFRVHAPVVVWWQLVRHRMAELNMSSGRYTEYEEDEFYVPNGDQWRLQDDKNKQGSAGTLNLLDGDTFTRALRTHTDTSWCLYMNALNAGVAKEQARLFLPAWTSYHTGIWKLNAHALLNFLRLRTDIHAQYEIRAYAEAVETLFAEMMPWTYAAYTEAKVQPKREAARLAGVRREAEFWLGQYTKAVGDWREEHDRRQEFVRAPLLTRVWHAIRRAA